MAVCQIHRYRGLAVRGRSYRSNVRSAIMRRQRRSNPLLQDLVREPDDQRSSKIRSMRRSGSAAPHSNWSPTVNAPRY
jgi:hypothetical protein